MAECLLADNSVEGLAELLNGLNEGVGLVVLGAEDDPVKALVKVLVDPQLQVLHLLGHGSPGVIQFEGGDLDIQALEAWSLSPPRDLSICIWSCCVGSGVVGLNFVDRLAAVTGAKVFASSKAIGNVLMGGVWSLDVTSNHAS